MEKLITNHAYLFIKQGLGEIQRGSTGFTSFNLQSVIKRNTAARLGCLFPSAFSRHQADPFLGVMSILKQGLITLLQHFSYLWAPG